MKNQIFILSLLFCGIVSAWGQDPYIWCHTTNSQLHRDFGDAYLTWQTADNGDVVITIDGATFRNGGFENKDNSWTASWNVLSGDGYATSESASEYFTGGTMSADNTTYTLTKKADLPSNAVVQFKGHAFSWKIDTHDEYFLNPDLKYTYGATCSFMDTPTDVAVTNEGVVTFTAVEGANKYIANVYSGSILKHTQEITNGGMLTFKAYVAGDYNVKLIASGAGKVPSEESESVVWHMAASPLPESEYCGEDFSSGNTACQFAWITLPNGNIEVTLTEPDGTVDAEKTVFRANAIDLNKLKVGKAAMSDYFISSYTKNVQTFSLINPDNAPGLGEKITYNAVVEYKVVNNQDAWPTLQFDYTYGTKCTVAPTSIVLASTATVVAGKQKQLEVSVLPMLAPQTVTWSSDNTTIATVDADGKITGVAEGEAVIRATSTENEDIYAECTVTVTAAEIIPDFTDQTGVEKVYDTNFALSVNGSVATASSGNAGNAIDGDKDSRWESASSDPQTWDLDMGQKRIFNTITIVWEGAYGKTFDIQLSEDGKEWYTMKTIEGQTLVGFPHQQDIDMGQEYCARYIRFNGRERGTGYGYSFYEFRVYLPAPSVLTTLEATIASRICKVGASDAITLLAKDQNGFVMSEYGTVEYTITPTGAGVVENGVYIPSQKGEATITAHVGDVSAAPFTVVAYDGDNLALNNAMKNPNNPAEYWCTYSEEHASYRAVDGDDGTEWQGRPAGEGTQDYNAWFVVDLQGEYDIDLITIHFEGACSDAYHIDFSTDAQTWATAYNFAQAMGNNNHTDYITSFSESTARYIRFWSTKAATDWGVKIFEFQVFGSEADDTEKPVMVSASLVSATSSSATIAVAATDNNQVVKYIVKESGGKTSELTPSNGQIQLTGLKAQTSYSVSIQAVDKAGNISDNFIVVEFTTAEGPKSSGQFFGTAQMQNVSIYDTQADKPNMNVRTGDMDYYIVSCGDVLLGKVVINGGNTFWPDADAVNFRTWNEPKSAFETNLAKAGNDSQNPTKKWMQIGAGDQHGLSEYGDMVPMTVFVKSWITPAGGGERVATHTTDFFDYHRGYINNPTIDATAPALDLNKVEVTDDEQSGKITFTISADAVTADDEYFFYVVDEAHELFAISLENTISIARPNETNGQTYTFRCYAVDFNGNMSESYKEYAITMPFDENTNLALNKANVSCGYVQEPNVASRANDGDATTFWTCYGTQELANAWWSVDLEAIYELNKLVVTWNDYSNDYTIYGSLDGTKWYAICNGAATEQGQTINHEITNAAARYLKVVSNKKKDVGIKEFEAYASSLAADDHQNPEVEVSEVRKEYGSATLQIVATDKDDDGIEHPVRTIIISDVDNQLEPAEYTLDADNQVMLSNLHFNTTYNFKVEVVDRVGNSTTKTLQVVLPFNPEVNLALNQPSFAGAVQDDAHTADKGNDGDDATFWSGFTAEDLTKDWWYVDLGVAYNVNKVVIKWMNDYAKHFVIQGAMTKAQVDNSQWTDVYENTYAEAVEGTTQEHVFTEAAAMRYLRILSKENSHVNGYEFYELEVYGTGFAADDTEAPEITLAEVLSTTHTTATLHLTAEDNVDGDLYDFYISEPSKGLEETKYTADENGQVVLTGLNSVLGEYNLTIRVRDAIGHWTSTTLLVQLGYSESWKNMALNKTATAGSVETGNEPSMANDESMSTRWANYGVVSENNSWWKVDMLYSCNVASVVILWEHYPDAGGIKIEASNDDQTWTQLFASEQSYSANSMQEIILTELTTNQYRYVRISAPGNQYMSIYDFRVYAFGMSVVIDEQSDNSAVIEAADGLEDNTVTLNRSFEADGANYTLCLPFDMTADQCLATFGANYKLWELGAAYMKTADVMYLPFSEVTAIEAGKPYLFCPAFNVVNPIIEGVTINAAAPVAQGNDLAMMTGIYSPYELPIENNYILGPDNWLYQSDGGEMYGLRCYFTFGSAAPANVRARAVFHDTDVVTDLETIEDAQHAMPNGKYIIDGQFVIIRNGKQYNAVGQAR